MDNLVIYFVDLIKKQKKKNDKKQPKNNVEVQTRNYGSMIINNGPLTKNAKKLLMELRKLMSPNTAKKLQVKSKNKLKDFVEASKALGSSHILSLSQNKFRLGLKFMKLFHGPTSYFDIVEYSNMGEIVNLVSSRIKFSSSIYKNPPLLIMANMSSSPERNLVASMFQSMFPTLNVKTIKISKIRRCLFLSYNEEDKHFYLRHYLIKLNPYGISKPLKNFVTRNIPNLHEYKDISEYFLKQNDSAPESEAEEDTMVPLMQKVRLKGLKNSKAASVKLIEIGPRIKLKLVKIKSELFGGICLYHCDGILSEEKLAEIKKKELDEKIKKAERIKVQNDNIKKKEKQRLIHKQKSLDGMAKKGIFPKPKEAKTVIESKKVFKFSRKSKDNSHSVQESDGHKPKRKQILNVSKSKNKSMNVKKDFKRK